MSEKNSSIKIVLAEKYLPNKFFAEKLGRNQATTSKIQISQCLDVDVQDLIRVPEHNSFKD